MNNKIFIFISEIKYSGAAKIATWLSNSFASVGYDVWFITYIPSDYTSRLNKNVNYLCLNCKENNRYFRTYNVIRKLRKVLKQERPGLVISFLPSESLFMLLARFGLKIPVIVAERSDPYLERNVVADLGRYLFRFADGAVFQTSGAKEYFPAVVQQKSVVIPNPAFAVETNVVPYNNRRNAISHVARLDIRQKRQDVLIKAFSIVAKQVENVTLEIYGDGPAQDKIESLVSSYGLGERVKLYGRVNDVSSRISGTKLFALTSDFEGIPNAIIEALSVGVPVVSTDCSPGGARELIRDGKNGFIVQRGDASDMAKKMIYLLENTEEASLLAKNAVSIVDDLSETRVFEQWEQYCIKVGTKYEQ